MGEWGNEGMNEQIEWLNELLSQWLKIECSNEYVIDW